MKKGIHPKFYKDTKVTDLSTGKTFILASTVKEISVDVTHLSHPFYTGKHRIVDTENLVKKFEAKRTSAVKPDKRLSRKEKRSIKSQSRKTTQIKGKKQLTLKDMLQQMK